MMKKTAKEIFEQIKEKPLIEHIERVGLTLFQR